MATAARGKKATQATGSLDSKGAGAESLALDVLQQDAATFEQSVRQLDDFSQERLDSLKPGGVANLDQSVRGWYEYVKQLVLWFASGPKQPTTMRWNEADMRDLSDALTERPVHVAMSDGVTRGIFPKGDYAIHRVSLLDTQLRWLVAVRLELEQSVPVPAVLETLATLVDYQSALEREFFWIATHPSPDVPWDDDSAWEHEAPDWTRACGGYDMLTVRAAYQEVNHARLNVIAARTHAMSSSNDETSPAAFLGMMATEMGVPARELARKWSKGMLYAQAFVKWDATERANRDAKAAA